MNQFICIKEIPHLCNVGEMGTIVTETFETDIEIVNQFCPSGWGFVKTLKKTALKFNFNTMFYENHVLLTLGKPILLNQHFKKI